MTFHTIADILSENERSHERLIAGISGINDAQANFRPSADEWTIAEIVEHLNIVNGGFLRITSKLLKQAEANPKPAPADLNLGGVIVDADGNPAPKFQAPEMVRPKGGVAIANAIAGLETTLAGFAELQSRLEAVDLSGQSFPHPVAGSLSAYQWMILLAEHSDRHLGQIGRIKAADGFPV